MIGAMSKRGQDMTLTDGSPMASALKYKFGDARSMQRGRLATKIRISSQSGQ